MSSEFSFYKDCDYSTTPLMVLPRQYSPEGFLAGYQVERRLPDESWQTFGYQGEDLPHNVHLRIATGELVFNIERPAHVPAPLSGEEDLPVEITKRDGDGFVRLEPLPEGWYRVAGIELNHIELVRLLPKLQPSWEGVLYPTTQTGEYAFWELNDGYSNWTQIHMKRDTLAMAADIGLNYLLSEAGPHTLYRTEYIDPMRPGLLHGLSRAYGFCVGYNRPNGPEMLLVVEPLLLKEYWPEQSLREVLSPTELEAANVAVEPVAVKEKEAVG
jgi:hypothetical protein